MEDNRNIEDLVESAKYDCNSLYQLRICVKEYITSHTNPVTKLYEGSVNMLVSYQNLTSGIVNYNKLRKSLYNHGNKE